MIWKVRVSPPTSRGISNYSFYYICCLCYGLLLDRSVVINARESRRMFASCAMRSGRMPSLLRTGRGLEVNSALMAEYCAIVGIGRRFGTPYRPVEQGLVECKHKETRNRFGMLVTDIMQCMPSEVG